MTDDRELLLRVPRRDLDRARRDPSTWPRLAFHAERTGDGTIVDRNGRARFGVVWAAQYDRRDEDLPLLRFLLGEEITRYRETEPHPARHGRNAQPGAVPPRRPGLSRRRHRDRDPGGGAA